MLCLQRPWCCSAALGADLLEHSTRDEEPRVGCRTSAVLQGLSTRLGNVKLSSQLYLPSCNRSCKCLWLPRLCQCLISALLVSLLFKSTSRKALDSGTAFPSITDDSLFICFLGFTFLIQLSPALQMFFPQLLTPSFRAGSHRRHTMKLCSRLELDKLSSQEPAAGGPLCPMGVSPRCHLGCPGTRLHPALPLLTMSQVASSAHLCPAELGADCPPLPSYRLLLFIPSLLTGADAGLCFKAKGRKGAWLSPKEEQGRKRIACVFCFRNCQGPIWSTGHVLVFGSHSGDGDSGYECL